MKEVKTAIIPCAGFGSRMFPVTKTVNKEMLPVLNRPIVDYVVEACLLAGVENIVFVVREGDRQIKDYYSAVNKRLINFYMSRGQEGKLSSILDIHTKANFSFIEQPQNSKYGTAIPLQLAANTVASESFAVMNGDCLSWIHNGSELSLMIGAMQTTKYSSCLAVKQISDEEVSRYGIVEYSEENGAKIMTALKEKPQLEETPSRLANLAHYIFTPDFLPYVQSVKRNDSSGEYYITDAIAQYAKDHIVLIHEAQGVYLDVGNPQAFVEANQIVASTES